MRKGITLGVLMLLLLLPVASAATAHQPHLAREKTSEATTPIICKIGDQTITTHIPLSTIQTLVEMGKAHEKDFLTIYDKTKPAAEVETAFIHLQPFFQALVEAGLTKKTVGDINALYHDIRDKIRAPRSQPILPKDGPQPAGLWNGAPTPVWINAMCGIFEAGQCAGFCLGTHTAVPTIGIDLFLTYQFAGTSITLGLSGNTAATIGFDVIFLFVGILLVTPGMMIGPYFMTGICGLVLGVGV